MMQASYDVGLVEIAVYDGDFRPPSCFVDGRSSCIVPSYEKGLKAEQSYVSPTCALASADNMHSDSIFCLRFTIPSTSTSSVPSVTPCVSSAHFPLVLANSQQCCHVFVVDFQGHRLNFHRNLFSDSLRIKICLINYHSFIWCSYRTRREEHTPYRPHVLCHHVRFQYVSLRGYSKRCVFIFLCIVCMSNRVFVSSSVTGCGAVQTFSNTKVFINGPKRL